ncbi:uncharacterized protein [Gossypium hirsutum]|uniref:Uncharacterized protein n=1 Tax=Gossypium hirsutum TaxID=3635 RepID=A0ABM2YMY2_GOSHI|nr:uncharacterized protein LOC121205025 [Gossypium hirsutum]
MIAKSRIEKEHVQVLRKLFVRLRKFQLKLNPAKCTFGSKSGKLLGFVVSEKGIEIDPGKVKAIQELSPPHTQKEKHNPGEWDEECQKAFDKVKQYLSNALVLMPPNPDKPLILYFAVFENSMGCILGQHHELGRKEKAIYCLSKKFTECETRMARWQILLSEFDIVYVNQKAVKGSAITDFLASRALEDYEPLNFDFSNEDLMCVATAEEITPEELLWKQNFDGASNAVERKIKVLEVYRDSALVIYQLKGEWETRDPKLVDYQKLILELVKEFDGITFCYLPRDENQMANALATLASMIKVNKQEDNREYPDQASENEKRTLRRLAIDYVLDGRSYTKEEMIKCY